MTASRAWLQCPLSPIRRSQLPSVCASGTRFGVVPLMFLKPNSFISVDSHLRWRTSYREQQHERVEQGAGGITSVAADRVDARQLLEWVRRHWHVENLNYHCRDRSLKEDDCLIRTNNGPGNRAMCSNIALALIIHQNRLDSVPQALRHFNLNRKETFAALFSPT